MPPPVPTPIVRINDFTQWQADHPNAPLPGDWVAADFDQSNDGINLLQDRLALIQRDDGQLVNEIVTPESLDPAVLALLDDAQNTATQAAIDAAAAAAQSATDAATSAANAAASDADAQAAAAAAQSAFLAEQGAQDAQAAAEAAAAQMPPPPLTPGMALVVNPAGTSYVQKQALLLDVDAKWDAQNKPIKNVPLAVNANDATPLTQVQGLISGAGSVPPPAGGDVDKVLTATGAAAFTWLAMIVARISDATAFTKAFLTGSANAGQAQAYLGVPPTTRAVNTAGGLQGGGDLSADRNLSLTDTGVAAAPYTKPNITVDVKGRITAIANGSTAQDVPISVLADAGKFLKTTAANVFAWALITVADLSDATAYMKGLLTGIANAAALLANIGAVPTTRTIAVTAPITGGGDLSANRSIGHADSGVVAGSYTNTNLTVDAKGHVTAASNGATSSAGGQIITAAVHAPALADNSKHFIYTAPGGCVVTIPAAAGLIDGWHINVMSGPGAGVITFNRSSTDNIISKATALASLSLPTPGDGGVIMLATVADARFFFYGKRSFMTGLIGLVLSTDTPVAHNLGVQPDDVFMYLVCSTANLNYAVNDIVNILFCGVNSGAGGGAYCDNVNIHHQTSNSIWWIPNKSTQALAAITAGSWKGRVKAQVIN